MVVAFDVAELVGVDVEADVGDVVEVFAGDEPDDFTDFALGKVAGEIAKGGFVHFFVGGQLGGVVEGGALGVGEERAGAIVVEGVEFGFVHVGFDREGTADVQAKVTDVDAGDLLADEESRFVGQN